MAALWVWRPRWRGHLFFVFVTTYATGRFFTEFYRGDTFRGEGLWLGLSTSQVVSVGLLSSGKGWFFSHGEMDELAGKLKHLNLVFLQSCYGESLRDDFFAAGARFVLSYPGKINNYLFSGVFLKYYYRGTSEQAAYQLAVQNFDFHMRSAPYSIAVAAMVEPMHRFMGTPRDADGLIRSLPMPNFASGQ